MSQTQLFRGPNRSVIKVGDTTAFRLHKTTIVVAKDDGSVTLDSGGWRTPTTARRSNVVELAFMDGMTF